MELPEAYIPIDRRLAIARGVDLPARTSGAALFADISGFTPLTETLTRELGPQRGAEELSRQLIVIYSALIAQVEQYRGSVISFSGDAITCWFDDTPLQIADCKLQIDGTPNLQSTIYNLQSPASLRALACALAMQEAMSYFAMLRHAPWLGVYLTRICWGTSGAVAVTHGFSRRGENGDIGKIARRGHLFSPGFGTV